jgi:hypothetical protein
MARLFGTLSATAGTMSAIAGTVSATAGTVSATAETMSKTLVTAYRIDRASMGTFLTGKRLLVKFKKNSAPLIRFASVIRAGA